MRTKIVITLAISMILTLIGTIVNFYYAKDKGVPLIGYSTQEELGVEHRGFGVITTEYTDQQLIETDETTEENSQTVDYTIYTTPAIEIIGIINYYIIDLLLVVIAELIIDKQKIIRSINRNIVEQ
jgi:hypothetical protein